MEFIAATNNPGKMAEMRRILERMGHTVRSQREAGVTLEPEENGTTFAENARIKARAICEAAGTAHHRGRFRPVRGRAGRRAGRVFRALLRPPRRRRAPTTDKLLAALAGVPAGKAGRAVCTSSRVRVPARRALRRV